MTADGEPPRPLARLERAMEILGAWEDDPQRGSREELLAAHPDLADLLAPMLDSGTDPADGPGPVAKPQRSIGPYVVREELGRGAMGVVYRARRSRPARDVALKVLPEGAGVAPRAVARFQREAELLARLQHPGITSVFDVGRDGGLHYFAMDLIQGITLDEAVAGAGGPGGLADGVRTAMRRRGLEVEDGGPWSRGSTQLAVTMARDVADALQHAHDAGVVHRDVKPSNILLRPDGAVLLTDFGLAREVGRPSMTATGDQAGTPYFMSPEQVSGQPTELDGRSDVWALGVTLYFMVTGLQPFPGRSSHDVTQRILRSDPLDPSRHDSGLPADLGAVILKCLEKDPARRYARAGDLADDLQALLDLRPVSARRAGPIARARRWARREPWQAAALALLALGAPAVFGLGVYVFAKQPAIEVGSVELTRRDVDRLLEEALVARIFDDWETVREATDRARVLDPGRSDTMAYHALALAVTGDREAARRFLRAAGDGTGERARVAARVHVALDHMDGRAEDAAEAEADLGPCRSPLEAHLRGFLRFHRALGSQRGVTVDRTVLDRAVQDLQWALARSEWVRPLEHFVLAAALAESADSQARASLAGVLDFRYLQHPTAQLLRGQLLVGVDASAAVQAARSVLQSGAASNLRAEAALLLTRCGHHQEAADELERLTEGPGAQPRWTTWGNRGAALGLAGDREQAIRCLEKAVALRPDRAVLFRNLALFHRDPERAWAAAQKARELAPDAPQVVALVARLLRQRGALDRADRELAAAAERGVEGVALAFERGRMELARGRREAATNLFHEMLTMDGLGLPQSALVHVELGRSAVAERRWQDALDHARTAIEHDPSLSEPWVLRSATLARSGRIEDALAAAAEAHERFPLVHYFPMHTGAIHLAAKRPEAAVAALEEAVRLSPDSANAHFELARAHRDLENLQDALAHAQRAVAGRPRATNAHALVQSLARQLGDRAAEEAELRRWARQFPEPEPLGQLAWFLAYPDSEGHCRDAEEAAQIVERVQAMLAESGAEVGPNYLLVFAEVAHAGGDSAAAMEYLRRAEDAVNADPERHGPWRSRIEATAKRFL